jgi:hypothetical protein
VVSGNILSVFKDGLESLRDPYPVQIDQDLLRSITITTTNEEKPLRLSRISAEAPWTIVAPVLTSADEDNVNKLVTNLQNLRAIRVEDAIEVSVPETPVCTIRLEGDWGETAREIRFFEPFTQTGDEQKYCLATVNDRPVVFTLQAEPRSTMSGNYSRLVSEICKLPVLPICA